MTIEQAAQVKNSTREKYAATYGSYKARFAIEENIPEDGQFPWREFAMWTIATVEGGDYSIHYKKLIRAAFIHQIKENESSEGAMTAARIIEHWVIQERQVVGEPQEKQRRSRKSRRMIPKEDWSILINHFNKNPSKWGIRAQNLFSASIGCGARPIEWIYAHLVGDRTIRIYNAKVKNVNAFNAVNPGAFSEGVNSMQESRNKIERSIEEKIRASGLDPVKDIALIVEIRKNADSLERNIFRDVEFDPMFLLPVRLTLKHVDQFFQEKFGPGWREQPHETLEDVFRLDFHAKVRVSIWRACKMLFGEDKLYSPADARSTFAANRKGQHGLAKTATDLGHTGTSKTRDHYAPARKAWKT